MTALIVSAANICVSTLVSGDGGGHTPEIKICMENLLLWHSFVAFLWGRGISSLEIAIFTIEHNQRGSKTVCTMQQFNG